MVGPVFLHTQLYKMLNMRHLDASVLVSTIGGFLPC